MEKGNLNTFRRDENDTGSPEVQIAALTGRIEHITQHLRTNKKDHSSRRGLMTMVNNRRTLLRYLESIDHAKYIKITEVLGIRRAK